MGPVKSNEMLLFSKRITADEAFHVGLVTEVYPNSTFDSIVWARLKEMSELPPQVHRTHLHQIITNLLLTFQFNSR